MWYLEALRRSGMIVSNSPRLKCSVFVRSYYYDSYNYLSKRLHCVAMKESPSVMRRRLFLPPPSTHLSTSPSIAPSIPSHFQVAPEPGPPKESVEFQGAISSKLASAIWVIVFVFVLGKGWEGLPGWQYGIEALTYFLYGKKLKQFSMPRGTESSADFCNPKLSGLWRKYYLMPMLHLFCHLFDKC